MSAASGVPGTRVGPFNGPHYPVLNPGEYGLMAGHWHGCTPNGQMANLSAHRVAEHEDGTITVSPSILISDLTGLRLWHGFLERGIWREC